MQEKNLAFCAKLCYTIFSLKERTIRLISEYTFENLGDGLEICVSKEHRFGTDAFLLADFAAARNKDTACDLCSGCGIVAMLLKRNFAPKKIYAVEIMPDAVEQMKLTVEKSNLSDFIPVCAYIKDFRA